MAAKRQSIRRIVAAAAVAVTAAAVAKELRKPRPERDWHGRVAGAIPYDFRMPTRRRMRDRWWNPDAPVLTPRVFGVGWDLNWGRMASAARRHRERAGYSPE